MNCLIAEEKKAGHELLQEREKLAKKGFSPIRVDGLREAEKQGGKGLREGGITGSREKVLATALQKEGGQRDRKLLTLSLGRL